MDALSKSQRHDGRGADSLRSICFDREIPGASPGRVLASFGSTSILCTASIESNVPPWMAGRGKGWLTAEYNMLPGSTSPRKKRDRAGKIDGRTTEIQRLVGRSLRAVVDMEALGERTITIDCDVLHADGGTRTAGITGAYVALVDALRQIEPFKSENQLPLNDSIAAVSVGMVGGSPMVDLDYVEDVQADVDMNVVMTGGGQFVEVQGTGEGTTFSQDQLVAMLKLARGGIEELTRLQLIALA
jgi:ribonuclease PH